MMQDILEDKKEKESENIILPEEFDNRPRKDEGI